LVQRDKLKAECKAWPPDELCYCRFVCCHK
jgi:hypothetical protein